MAASVGRICLRVAAALLLFYWFTSLPSLARRSPSASSSNVILLATGKNNTIVIIPAFPNLTVQPCLICVTSSKERCISRLELEANKNISFSFNCTNPQNYYKMEIQKFVDCMSDIYYSRTVNFEPSKLPQLNRTFIWRLKAATRIGLDFTFSSRLKQLAPSETCPGSIPYNISSLNSETVTIGTFCTGGSVSRIRIQGGAEMTMDIPWNITLDMPGFNVTSGMSIRRLCIIEVVLVPSVSVSLFSPNYPLGFPDDDFMAWNFIVPPKYCADVLFLNTTLPNCEKKEERVEYILPESKSQTDVRKLTDVQPANISGNFNLSLRNCEVSKQDPGALNLHFQTTIKKQWDSWYTINLNNTEGINITINQRSESSKGLSMPCFICTGPTDCGTRIILISGFTYRISFECSNMSSLRATAEVKVVCTALQSCRVKNMPLYQGIKQLNLPLPLDEITWKLTAPEECSVELTSKQLKLQQHMKEKPCSKARYYIRSYIDDLLIKPNFGVFCPNGSIEKIQVKKNATIVMDISEIASFDAFAHHDLSVSFVPHLSEEYIFVVSPNRESVTYLLTPNGEFGMPHLLSVSWSILVPSEQVALLKFVERASVTCEFQHVSIVIKEQTPNSYELHRREDESLPDYVRMNDHFWVNISNCRPDNGTFHMKLLLKVTKKSRDTTLIIILAAVAAFLILLTAIVTVFCIKKRKKITTPPPPVGIYNAGISREPPTRPTQFPKGRKDNESHVYAVIDDSMVYGHLLRTADSPIPEIDVYRPFDGKMGDIPPTPPPPLFLRKGTNADSVEDDSRIPLKDNDLYTFSHHKKTVPQGNGETNSPLLATTKAES